MLLHNLLIIIYIYILLSDLSIPNDSYSSVILKYPDPYKIIKSNAIKKPTHNVIINNVNS